MTDYPHENKPTVRLITLFIGVLMMVTAWLSPMSYLGQVFVGSFGLSIAVFSAGYLIKITPQHPRAAPTPRCVGSQKIFHARGPIVSSTHVRRYNYDYTAKIEIVYLWLPYKIWVLPRVCICT